MPRLVKHEYEKVPKNNADIEGEYNTMQTKTSKSLHRFKIPETLKKKIGNIKTFGVFFFLFLFTVFFVSVALSYNTETPSIFVHLQFSSDYNGGGYRVYQARDGVFDEFETPVRYGDVPSNGSLSITFSTTKDMFLVPTTAYGDDGEAVAVGDSNNMVIHDKKSVSFVHVLESVKTKKCVDDVRYACVKQSRDTFTSPFFFGKVQVPLNICLTAPGFETSYTFLFFDTSAPTYKPQDLSLRPYKEKTICRYNYKKTKVSVFKMCLQMCMLEPKCTDFSFDIANMECRYSSCGKNNVDTFNNTIVCRLDAQCQEVASEKDNLYKIDRNIREYSVANPPKKTKGVRLILYDDAYCKNVHYVQYEDKTGLILPYLGYEVTHLFQYKRDTPIWRIEAKYGCNEDTPHSTTIMSKGGFPSFFQRLKHLGRNDSKTFDSLYPAVISGNDAYCNQDGSVVFFYIKQKCPIGKKAPYSATNLSQCF